MLNTDRAPNLVVSAGDTGVSSGGFMSQGTHVQQGRKSWKQSSKLVWCVKDAVFVLCSWEGQSSAVGGGVWAVRESVTRVVTFKPH